MKRRPASTNMPQATCQPARRHGRDGSGPVARVGSPCAAPALPKASTPCLDEPGSNRVRVRALVEDRQRISRDLHDSVLQTLYAIGLGVETCRQVLGTKPSHVPDHLEQIARQVDEAIQVVRALLDTDLGRTAEPEADLNRDLPTLISNLTSSLPCQLTIDPQVEASLTQEQRRHMLHLVREALSNSLRHARATTLTVSLEAADGRTRLIVADDGIGFTPCAAGSRGLGLKNLAARARLIGGHLEVRSRPWHGTRITLELRGAP